MDTLGSLSSHLPNRPPVEQELAELDSSIVSEFKAAACAVAKLYKLSGSKSRLLKSQGYLECLHDLIQYITNTEAETVGRPRQPATLEGVLNWALNKQHDLNASASSSCAATAAAAPATHASSSASANPAIPKDMGRPVFRSTSGSQQPPVPPQAQAPQQDSRPTSRSNKSAPPSSSSASTPFTFTSSLLPAYLSTEMPTSSYNGNIFHYNPNGSPQGLEGNTTGDSIDGASDAASSSSRQKPQYKHHHRKSHVMSRARDDSDGGSDSDVLEDILDDEYPSRLNYHRLNAQQHNKQKQHARSKSRSSSSASSQQLQGSEVGDASAMETDAYLGDGNIRVLSTPSNPLKRNIYMASSSMGLAAAPLSTQSASEQTLALQQDMAGHTPTARDEVPSFLYGDSIDAKRPRFT